MKVVKVVILLSLIFYFPQLITGQQIKGNEIVIIEGEKFILHQVRTGETLSSISRDFNVDRAGLLKVNPNAESGIFIGEVLKIPYREGFTIIPITGNQKGEPTRFEYHTIESRNETPYFIARKNGITVEDIYAYNPEITRFNRGTRIRIPKWDVSANVLENNVKAPEQTVVTVIEHRIESGETLWGLAHKYNVSETDLKEMNPVLNNGFPAGTVIKIPVKSAETANNQLTPPINGTLETITSDEFISTGPCLPQPPAVYSNTTFNVALFLPFFLEANHSLNRRLDIENDFNSHQSSASEIIGSDSVIEIGKNEDMFIGFYRNTEEYLQFYEGVLLAVDSMQKAGMNIRLNVYDTQQNSESVRKIIASENFLNTNLIIGPVFPNEQRDMAEFSAKNRIPMISPLSAQSGDILINPYYFQVNPDRDYLSQKTAEMVAKDFSGSNIIIFKTGNYTNTPEAKMVDLIREKVNGSTGYYSSNRFIVYDFKNSGIAGLQGFLSKERENVIFIPTGVEGELSIGISNINNLANEFPITLIGTNRYPQYESLQIEYFHNLKLTYVTPYWTDYEKRSTQNYIEKFKKHFLTEPNNFGMQGYDVTFYFLNALKNYGHDFRNCLPYLNLELTQGNYHFDKVSQLGGYLNHGVSVITYKRDYDVVRKRVEAK
jgi:LysM repeat protein/ABC-type branched-subunit amino acid transport system substrate-binding protein